MNKDNAEFRYHEKNGQVCELDKKKGRLTKDYHDKFTLQSYLDHHLYVNDHVIYRTLGQ